MQYVYWRTTCIWALHVITTQNRGHSGIIFPVMLRFRIIISLIELKSFEGSDLCRYLLLSMRKERVVHEAKVFVFMLFVVSSSVAQLFNLVHHFLLLANAFVA